MSCRPPSRVESCQAPLSINPQVSTYFWSEGSGHLRWDVFMSLERESEHNIYQICLFIHSSSCHFCYILGPGWMDRSGHAKPRSFIHIFIVIFSNGWDHYRHTVYTIVWSASGSSAQIKYYSYHFNKHKIPFTASWFKTKLSEQIISINLRWCLVSWPL